MSIFKLGTTRVTFDVAADDGSGFTPWEVDMPHEEAATFVAKVAWGDPESVAIFCGQCPTGLDVTCPHDAPHVRYIAVGNLRLRPLDA